MQAAPLGRSGTGASGGNGIGTAEACDDGLLSDQDDSPRALLDMLAAMAKSDAELDEYSRVIEIYTMEGPWIIERFEAHQAQ